MSKITYITLAILAVALVACKKDLSTGDADFNVNIEKSALTLGDTARFNFTGNPDLVTFFSGEVGKRFEYSGRTTAAGKPLLSFRTVRANGSQANSLQLMVSSDFKGVEKGNNEATKANIAAATWTDITSRAVLSTGGSAATPSGDIDLSDFAALGKPVFIAFKYNGAAGSAQNKWTITNFSLKNSLADGTTYEIANLNSGSTPYQVYGVDTFSPGFASYALKNTFFWDITSTQLVITGATPAANATAVSEAWVFIGAIDLRKVTPDVGVLIKNPTQSLSTTGYRHRYSSKGTYNATFVGGKVDIGSTNLTQKSLNVVIN